MFKARIAALAIALLPAQATAETVTVEVWADNWFALYVNGQEVLEDSVPITTERSFNAEQASFQVDLPAQVAFIAKDFKENDTGLEYIGSRRQQMGDGGLIAQFTTGSSAVIGVTDRNTRCLVIHRAPVDIACERERAPREGQGACASVSQAEPRGWQAAGFDDSAWPSATEHSVADVRPKDGYDRIRWAREARLIWSPDLKQDNTLLCRMVIGG